MEKFKKNLGFNLALILLGCAFITFLVLDVLVLINTKDGSKRLDATLRQREGLLKGYSFANIDTPVALTKENVKKAEESVITLENHLLSLKAAIAGNPEMAFRGRATRNSAEISALLRESVEGWRKVIQEQGIKMPPNEPISFGFHRYIHNQGTAPKKNFQLIDQQRQIIDFLVKQLVESRLAGTPLLVQSIDREPVETFIVIPEGKPGAGTLGPDPDVPRIDNDEFIPTRTFARTGQVSTLSFRVRFVAHTPTLRTFINKLQSSGRPLAITVVKVDSTSKEVEKLFSSSVNSPVVVGSSASGTPTNFFEENTTTTQPSSQKGAPTEEKRLAVVHRKLSAFVVQLDFLSIVEDKPSEATNGITSK